MDQYISLHILNQLMLMLFIPEKFTLFEASDSIQSSLKNEQ